MDARQARRASKTTRDDDVAKKREEKRKAELHIKKQGKAGRVEARKRFMPEIRKAIGKATARGVNHSTVRITGGMFGAPDSDAFYAYYSAACKRLKVILEEEGYKVETRVWTQTHDGGGGSDPLFYGTKTGLNADLKLRW